MYCNIVLIFCVFICTGHVKGAYQKKDFLGGVETFFGGHTCACMQHVHSARTVQGGYNSALGGHRELPKVANERYGNIVLIFCVFYAHAHLHVKGTHQKKCFLGGAKTFIGGAHARTHKHAACVQWVGGITQPKGPLGAHGCANPPQGL